MAEFPLPDNVKEVLSRLPAKDQGGSSKPKPNTPMMTITPITTATNAAPQTMELHLTPPVKPPVLSRSQPPSRDAKRTRGEL
eukprot:scaffold624_cov206-Alexandrium_tamarense.AAC.6